MNDNNDPYAFVLTRKPALAAPPAFTCVHCRRLVEPSPRPYDRHEKPPLCGGCVRRFSGGYGANFQGGTRGERRHMERLLAMAEILKWESINGRFTAR